MSLVIENLKVFRDSFGMTLSSLVVERGSCLFIFGPSGSGKSTFLSAIAGFVPRADGSIQFEGRELSSLPPEKRQVAYLFQKPALFPHWTVRQNVELPLRVRGVAAEERARIAAQGLARVSIGDLSDRYPHQLSGGQAQRVAIARALVSEFPILLLDEPFAGLDAKLREELLLQLGDLMRERRLVLLLVSHDWSDGEGLSQQVLRFENGQGTVTHRP